MFGFLLLGDFFTLTKGDWCALLIACALVLSGEVINTAIENVVDMVTKDYNEYAKKAKDAASGAVLINASRGECVATEATKRDDLTYVTDVWENEPKIDGSYLAKSLVATPHIAGYSAQGKANATAMAVQALARHFDLPLKEWRPLEVEVVMPKLISWQDLCSTIQQYCDLAAESADLQANPGEFEQLRNNYSYREEYF